MGRLDGKVAIISGGARGQGEAQARRFVAEGASVLLGDVLDDQGQAVADDLGDAAAYRHLDVREEAGWAAAVDEAVERFGSVTVLINNAGILRVVPLEYLTVDEFRELIDVNQIGTFLGMRSVIPAMRAAGGGSIVNTSSVAGLRGEAYFGAYGATKWAIRGMTKTAALELGRAGIRVNSVHPGGIDTPMIQRDDIDQSQAQAIYAPLPVPRAGTPEEVADLMVFLASDESSYCTGAEFVIDGGMTAGSTFANVDPGD